MESIEPESEAQGETELTARAIRGGRPTIHRDSPEVRRGTDIMLAAPAPFPSFPDYALFRVARTWFAARDRLGLSSLIMSECHLATTCVLARLRRLSISYNGRPRDPYPDLADMKTIQENQ